MSEQTKRTPLAPVLLVCVLAAAVGGWAGRTDVTGGAWAIIVLTAAAAASVVLWARADGGRREARRRAASEKLFAAQAASACEEAVQCVLTIAGAIQRLGPSPWRDELMAKISDALTDKQRRDLERLLRDHGVYVKGRRQAFPLAGIPCPPAERPVPANEMIAEGRDRPEAGPAAHE